MRVSLFCGVSMVPTASSSTELLSLDSFLGGGGAAAVVVVVAVAVAKVEGGGVVE